MFRTGIIYSDNILVSLEISDIPYGINSDGAKEISPGLKSLVIKYGYMESPNLQKIFNDLGLMEKVIFYGAEEIKTNNFFMKIFVLIKRLNPGWISIFDFPYNKLHGVVTRIEI